MAKTNSAALLLHPVRMRIVRTLLGDRRMTTADLAAELPDVSTATVYRQVATLAEAGVLIVVDERKVRAAVERTYALHLPGAQVTAEDLAAMSVEDHQRAFMAFVAGLLTDFDRYLDLSADVDYVRDGVGYRQTALWLSDEELTELVGEIRAATQARAANTPTEDRQRRLLATVLVPSRTGTEPADRPDS